MHLHACKRIIVQPTSQRLARDSPNHIPHINCTTLHAVGFQSCLLSATSPQTVHQALPRHKRSMHMYGTRAAHRASMQGPPAQAHQCMARPNTRQHPASTPAAAGDTRAAHCSSSQAPLYSKHKAVAQLHTPPLAFAQFKLQRPHVRRLPQHPRAQGFAPRMSTLQPPARSPDADTAPRALPAHSPRRCLTRRSSEPSSRRRTCCGWPLCTPCARSWPAAAAAAAAPVLAMTCSSSACRLGQLRVMWR